MLRTQGPFTGVIGFSQGGFCAGIIASLLEPGRKEAFAKVATESDGIPYPAAFKKVQPIKFSVSIAGYAALNSRYKAFYVPKISEPLLHVNGALDQQVDDRRSRTLINGSTGTEEERVLIHPGAHVVPKTKLYTDAIIMWIRHQLEEADGAVSK